MKAEAQHRGSRPVLAQGWSKQAVEARREARRLELETELIRLRDLLAARPEVRRVILFGSLAEGTPGEVSDLDLAVVAESDLPFLERYTEYVCYLKPRVSLDLLVYTPGEWRDLVADSHFVRRISGEGRVLYETAA